MKRIFAASAAILMFSGVAHASTVSIQYFEVLENAAGGDFGVCCSSPPATSPDVAVGDLLKDGLPVSKGNVIDVNGLNEVLWWTPGQNGITATGSGTANLPYGSNMFAPNSTGSDNSKYFETAIVSGTIHGTGSDVTLNVSSDDDTLVYLNGVYVGGNQGVHGLTGTTIDLGDLSGGNSLEVFYADRAQVAASLDLSVTGATVSAVPETSTWLMMLAGFLGLGLAGYRKGKQDMSHFVG